LQQLVRRYPLIELPHQGFQYFRPAQPFIQ
jgi:hypothetical protein